MKFFAHLGAAAALALGAACGAPEDTAAPARTAPDASSGETAVTNAAPSAEIPADTLRRHIATLSADDFEGRAPATPGGEKTRAYLIQEMERIGLEPANAGSFEQPVTLVEATVDPAQSFLTIDGEPLAYGGETVFWTKRVEESVSFEDSEVVFVGYGVVAPEYGWNDYEGLDVAGKTVVMLVNDPGYATEDPDLFNGRAMTYYGRWTYKYEEAARQGAAAAIVVHQTAPASYGWGVVSQSWTGPQLDLERPDGGASRATLEGWVQEETARALFARAGLDFDAAAQSAQRADFTPVAMGDLKASARIVNTIRRSMSANVAGVLPGAEHPDEYILYVAHWDHLGDNARTLDGDRIANGAVDNATGTGGILAIAEAFAQNEVPPARSIMFMGVTAEESGLLGSAYFAEDPLAPLEHIVGGINVDALHPTPLTRDVTVIGYGASELEDLLKAAADKRGMVLRPDASPQSGFFYRSDHISLAKKGVPMLYVNSGVDYIDGGEEAGLAYLADYNRERYHKPADEYDENWDLSGMTHTLNILYDVGAAMAYSDDWPNWYPDNEFRALRDAQRSGE